MKTDADKYATEIRINQYGQVDVEYYYNKALQMRAECSAEMYTYAKQQIKEMFNQLLGKLVGDRILPTH